MHGYFIGEVDTVSVQWNMRLLENAFIDNMRTLQPKNYVHSCSKVMGFFFAVAKYGVYF